MAWKLFDFINKKVFLPVIMKIVPFILLLSTALFAQVEEELQKNIDLVNNDPGNYHVYNKIGLLYIQKNDLQNAKNYFVKSIIINNNYFEGYYNLGTIYYKQEKYNDALVNFKRAEAINKSSDLSVSIINCLLQLKQVDEAQTCVNEAMEQYKDNYKLYNTAGVIQLFKNNFSAAKGYFQTALKLQDNNKIRSNLAVSEYYLGNRDDAKKILKDLKKSLHLFDDNFKSLGK